MQNTETATQGLVQDRQQMLAILKENMTLTQQRMKKYADTHRSERQFDVGDWVFIKMQPFKVGNTMLKRRTKLSVKYFGPFQVRARVGEVAYQLDLPPSTKMHNVFHVSLLKKKLKTRFNPIPKMPKLNSDGVPQTYPIAILGTRHARDRNRTVEEALVQWQGLPPEMATWEQRETIFRQYPNFDMT